MDNVVVLAHDGDGGMYPVPYYATSPNDCLDFDSSPSKPRAALTEISRKQMDDCEHGVHL